MSKMRITEDFFITLTGLLKNINYYYGGSPEFEKYRKEIDDLVARHV